MPQGVESEEKLKIAVGLYEHWLYKTLIIMSCGAENIYHINIIEN